MAAPSGTSSPADHHRPDVQGLRALAVLVVVAFHVGGSPVGGTRAGSPLAALAPSGFVGVDVFFVVSGYVITAMLLRERARTGRTSFGDFYARRARRLLPALALVSVVVVALSVVVLSPFGPQQFAVRTALAANLFVANVYLYRHTGYFDASAAQNPFLHTWSLSVEEQTYLVLPVGLALAAAVGRVAGRWRRRADGDRAGDRDRARARAGDTDRARGSVGARAAVEGRTAMVVATAVVSVFSLAVTVGLWSGWRPGGAEAPERLAFLGTPARLWEFGVGALVALCWPWLARVPRAAAEVLGVAGLTGVVVAAVALDPGAPWPGPATGLPVVATAAVLVAGARPTLATRLLSVRPAVWLGDRSYSWYLWHWPAVVLAVAVWPGRPAVPLLAAVAALVPAWAAHRWVEQPLRSDVRIVGRRAAVLAGSCVAVVALVAGGAWVGAGRGWGLTEELGWYDLPQGRNVGCHLFNRDNDGTWPGEVCTTRPPGSAGTSRGTFLVLGDLTADSAAPAVVAAAHDLGFSTAQWTRSGCPYLGRTPVHAPRCAEWQERAAALVDRLDPALVVLSADSPAYTTDARAEEEVARADGAHPGSSAAAVEEWAAGLAATLDDLRRRGVPVVVVGAPPVVGPGFPRERLSLLRPDPPVPAPTRADAERRRAAVVAAERRVVAARPGTVFVDPFEVLCDERCPAVVDGVWRYYDDRHLTISGSELLADEVAAAARSVLGGR